jgi:predicted DNA-binding transcriptional regulator AlpA
MSTTQSELLVASPSPQADNEALRNTEGEPSKCLPCSSPEPQTATIAVTHELLTDREVAAMLGIGVRSVWRKAQDGRLPPPVKVGGSTRWVKSTMREWINTKEEAAERLNPPTRRRSAPRNTR